jgi:hypothetical protein
LTINECNRPISDVAVDKYSTDAANEQWSVNGESMKFSIDGFMNDGQHRCLAVIQTGRPIQTVFTFGVTRESRFTLDQGRARRIGDYLAMKGVSDANVVAAVASLLFQYYDRRAVSNHHSLRPTKQQTQDAAEHYQDDIANALEHVPRRGSTTVGGMGTICFCFVLCAKVDQQDAEEFFQKLMKGEDLKAKSPILVARERLRTNKRMRVEERAELILRAWNAWREKREVKSLQVLGGLPEIV